MWYELDDYRCLDCGRPSEMCKCEVEDHETVENL